MKRYLNNNGAVILPDKPFTRDINAVNKLAYVICYQDKVELLMHNKSLEVPKDDIGINQDDFGWFISDFYEDD
jgi:hypothetical protein